jgi:hypothetical protein
MKADRPRFATNGPAAHESEHFAELMTLEQQPRLRKSHIFMRAKRLPLARVLMLTPRPSMPPGRYIKAGGKVGQGRVDFCRLIFEQGWKGAPELGRLHRDDFPRRHLYERLAVHVTELRHAI